MLSSLINCNIALQNVTDNSRLTTGYVKIEDRKAKIASGEYQIMDNSL